MEGCGKMKRHHKHDNHTYGAITVAEGAGFDPAWTFALTVFKTAPL